MWSSRNNKERNVYGREGLGVVLMEDKMRGRTIKICSREVHRCCG